MGSARPPVPKLAALGRRLLGLPRDAVESSDAKWGWLLPAHVSVPRPLRPMSM